MTLFQRIDYWISTIAAVTNQLAAAAVVGMMLLTTADVVLRFFRCPIPGTYEIVSFLGAIMISFSLAATSINRGHIAVDFLAKKLPAGIAGIIERINTIVCAVMFVLITRYLLVYAADARRVGEVSMTLQIPVYPFIYGIAAGCAILCGVFILQVIRPFAEAENNSSTGARR